MSNAVVVKVISASVRKVFAAQKFEAMISGLVKYEDGVQVTPSMISMTKAGAGASMGAKATPQSFINGLLFAISAHAYGQKPPEGLPAHGVHAVEHAQSMIKKGAGIDARTLKLCALSCMEKVLAMPTKSEQAAIEEGLKPVIEGEFKVIPEVIEIIEIDDLACYGTPMDNSAAERAYVKAMRMESLAAKALAAQQAEIEAHAAQSAVAKSKQGQDFVSLFDKLAADHADQAEEMLRTMAAHLGYRLTKIPAKKAA